MVRKYQSKENNTSDFMRSLSRGTGEVQIPPSGAPHENQGWRGSLEQFCYFISHPISFTLGNGKAQRKGCVTCCPYQLSRDKQTGKYPNLISFGVILEPHLHSSTFLPSHPREWRVWIRDAPTNRAWEQIPGRVKTFQQLKWLIRKRERNFYPGKGKEEWF